MKAFKWLIVGALAMAALGATAYAATVGVSEAVRPSGRVSVTPLNYYIASPQGGTIDGSSRNDVLMGLGGADRLDGGPGNDLILGGAGNDTLLGGPGRDRLLGGEGNDRFFSRDGDRDVIDGGPGFDRAWVDRHDVVTHVELVYRR